MGNPLFPDQRNYYSEMVEALTEIKKSEGEGFRQQKVLIEQNYVIICCLQNPGMDMYSEEFQACLKKLRGSLGWQLNQA